MSVETNNDNTCYSHVFLFHSTRTVRDPRVLLLLYYCEESNLDSVILYIIIIIIYV